MKRILSIVLAILLCVCAAAPAFAADSAIKLTYDLTAEGSTLSGGTNEVKAKQGDVITVTYTVKRTDSTDGYQLNSIQNEIKFNKNFFEFVANSVVPKTGSDGGLVEKIAGTRIYLNDMDKTYDATTAAGTFQLRVKASSGSGMVECTECLAYDGDGSSITVTCQNLKVTIDGGSSGDGGDSGDSGNSGGPGGGGPGGGGGGGSDADSKTVTVPVSGDQNSIRVDAAVEGSVATLQIDTDKLHTVVGEKVRTGTVEIDLTSLGSDVNSVVIPNGALKVIAAAVSSASNDADGLCIQLADGSVTFDAKALNAVLGQAGSGDLTLVVDDAGISGLKTAQVKALENDTVLAVYDIYLMANGKRISDLGGGEAEVTVRHKLAAGQSAADIAVLYLAESGAKTNVPFTVEGNEVVFTVTHFSNYIVTYSGGAKTEGYASCPKDASCVYAKYTDASTTAWYHDGVHFCVERGLMNGMTDTRFAPSGALSRAMIVTILWRLEGKPTVNYAMSFGDVSEGMWYTDAIRWAQSTKVVTGYSSTSFGPTNNVTREQLAAILMRYAAYKGIDVSPRADLSAFTDAGRISSWAMENVKWANAVGILNGRTATTIVPGGNATRAEAASMIQRFCETVIG